MRKSVLIALILVMALVCVTIVASGCSNASRTLDMRYLTPEEEPPAPVFHWPLTSEETTSEVGFDLRPISIKISNAPEVDPQTGLIDADIVYEFEAEGGISRFNAVFQSKLPPMVGSVRSARLTDIWVCEQWNSYLVTSGMSDSVRSALRNAGLDVLTEERNEMWERVRGVPAPHDLFVNLTEVPRIAAAQSIETTWTPRSIEFDIDPSFDATPTATHVTVPIGPAQKSVWEWNVIAQRYLRSQKDKPHVDAVTGEQIDAANVIVMWADTTKFELGGAVSVFKGGVRYDGTWTTPQGSPPVIVDANGMPILLNPGKTWFQIVKPSAEITVVGVTDTLPATE